MSSAKRSPEPPRSPQQLSDHAPIESVTTIAVVQPIVVVTYVQPSFRDDPTYQPSGSVPASAYSQPPPYPGPPPPYGAYAKNPPRRTDPTYSTPQMYPPESASDYDIPEAMFAPTFTDKAVRAAFVRKVYLILMTQLLVTTGVIALFIFEENTRRFVLANVWLYYLSFVVFIVTYFTIICCRSVRRKFPFNFIMLGIFTLAMSFMTATISTMNNTRIVFYSMGICVIVCLGISLFAMQTRLDFTRCTAFLFIFSIVMLIFGIVAIFWRIKIVQLIYSSLMALLFCLFLAYDTQQIMGGHREELSPEEYIMGALQLYLDVVYIFLSILSIFGQASE